MTDPLSISASIAGLMTIADIVIRNGYKYIKAVKESDKAVASLINEVNSLSGTLHSLRNIAEGLEGEHAPFISTTQVHHVESCYRTLRNINELLDKFEFSKTKGLVERATQRLKWPLTHSETKTLALEVARHRETLTLALNADEMSALIVLLARQDTIESTLLEIERGLENNRAQRKAVKLNDYYKKILEWLCPATSVDPSRNQESAVSLRQPGTGVWFTDSNEFQEWKLKNNSRLWLHGIPGAGKTILMSTVIQDVEKGLGYDDGFAFFYCDYKVLATQEPSNIFGSLIKQLVFQKEDAFALLASFYESHSQPFGSRRSPNPESLLRMLHNITDLFPLTTILIDGLDEITKNRFDAVQLLRRIQQEPRRIRTLFASRCETDIEQCLDGFEQVSIVARSSDLELYVASEIETRTRKKELNIKDPDLKEKIMKRLIHGADGMFRWVACQIDHLCELPTDKARSKALDQLPRGLPETYERILGRVLESHKEIHDLVSRALQWLACARGTLGRDALLEALSIVPGDTHLNPDSMTTEDDILRWCSSLVRRQVTGDGIELAHFTEYLVSIDSDKDTKFAPFKVDSKKSDKLLGQVCLTYLNLDHFGQYPPPQDIFDNIYSDLESEEQNSDFDEYDDMNDEDEDSEDTSSDEDRHSIDAHDSNQAVLVEKERLGTDLNVQTQSDKPNTRVTADVAFKPYLDRFPLLLYAAGRWDEHLRSYMEDPLVVQLSHKLFHPEKGYQFLWWTYAFMCKYLEDGWEQSFPETTTLHWAALVSLPEVCSWLISQGSDVNRTSEMGSPLDCALITDTSLFRRDEGTLIEMMLDQDPPTESTKGMEVVDPASITILRLIQAGAKLDKITSPDYVLVPLEMALVSYPHNSEVINHFLDCGALITEHALEIVETYLERGADKVYRAGIPSSIVTIFSETARKNVSDAAQSIYQRLSVGLTRTISSKVEAAGIAHGESGVTDHTGLLKKQFLQASEYGVYKTVASLISPLRKVDFDDKESTLTLGLGLALQNNHENVVHLLLESEVNPNIVRENGESPAHMAMKEYANTDLDITIRNIKTLVKHGADLMIGNKRGELVLHLAARLKHDTLLKEVVRLMGNEMTQKAVSILRPSLLQYAVKSGADANVTFLLEMYQEINPEDHRLEDGTSLMGLAASRKTDVALRLLQQRGLATDILSRDGSSVLYHATKGLSERCFNFLMEINTVDNSARSDGRMAIHEAVDSSWGTSTSKLVALLRAGEDPNVRTADGSTPLQLAVSRLAEVGKLQILLDDERTNMNCKDALGMTPLMSLSNGLVRLEEDNKLHVRVTLLSCIECLIKHKADVDLVDLNNRTTLHYLCINGVTSSSFGLIKLLVTSGASLCAKDAGGNTPFEVLFVACVEPERRAKYFSQSNGFDPNNVLRFIINNALDSLNDRLRSGIPPLSFALEWRHTTAVDLLLSKEDVSVDIRKTSGNTRTALEIAASTGCTVDTARTLLSRTNKSVYDFDPARGYTLLHFATCDMTDQTVLKQLLQGGIDIEVLNRAAENPLHTAVSQGNCRAVRLLLEAGANTATPSGAMAILPLHLAAQAGRLPIVQTLVEFGADVNASSKDTKSTALHYASRSGSWDLVSFLIKTGALIDERDVSGATPCLVAAKTNHWHIVRKLTKFADLSVPGFDGLGVLHYAILAGSISLVRFLKKHCPALPQDIRDREGKIRGNELTCAIASGNIDLFKMFWEDESKNFISDYGWGLAHFAVRASANDVRNLLLPHITEWNLSTANMYSNAHPDRRYHHLKGLCPFHDAVLHGNHTAITFLREKDLISDINALTIGGEAYSSMHLSTISDRPSTVRLLANIGADLNLKDKPDGQTPLHIAARLGFAGTVTALLDAGCMPNLTDDYGMTPELLAIEHEHHAVAKILGQHLDSLESNIDLRKDNNSSTSVLETHHGKPWKLPLAPSPHMSKVMTSNVSIYAVHNTECPEALYKALEECDNHGVYNLKKPFKRFV